MKVQFDKYYLEDQFFGTILRHMTGEMVKDKVQNYRATILVPSFRMEDMLYYKNLLCMPRCCVRKLLHLAHNFKVSGNFFLQNTIREEVL